MLGTFLVAPWIHDMQGNRSLSQPWPFYQDASVALNDAKRWVTLGEKVVQHVGLVSANVPLVGRFALQGILQHALEEVERKDVSHNGLGEEKHISLVWCREVIGDGGQPGRAPCASLEVGIWRIVEVLVVVISHSCLDAVVSSRVVETSVVHEMLRHLYL